MTQKRFGSMGASSVLMIFVVLCLTAFGVLSLVSARADLRLTRRAVQAAEEYYAADAGTDALLGAVDNALAAARKETASGEDALNEIRAELKSQGYLKYYKQRDKRQKPADFLRFTSSDGFEILVGRNNAQNDKLTLHTARGKDLWFHVQKAPGSHVVVMSHGEDIPDTTKQEAAELAVIYSSAYKAGTGAKVAVDTTEVKNIWKANGAKPGMVLYEVYTTVYITPRDGLEEQLKKK